MTPNPTVMEAVRLSTEYLGKHGVESARLSAEHLLARALGCSRLDLYLKYDQAIDGKTLEKYRTDLKKRAAHYPLQYILGEVEFMSLRFAVREGVFIPRPETELLVERVEKMMAGRKRVRFAEFGTGTGVISGSLARRNPEWTGVAFDISAEASSLAAANFESLGVSERILVFAADGFGALSGSARFDAMISNPPYVPAGEIPGLQKEVSLFENRTALDGGAEGIDFYHVLAEAGGRMLAPGGLIALEIGAGQAAGVEAILAGNGFRDIMTSRDYNGIHRVVTALL